MLDFFIFTPLLNKKARISGPTKLQNFVGDLASNKKRRNNAPLIAEYYIIK